MLKQIMLLLLLSVSLVSADVVINEFMARNRGAHANAAGDDSADWIELHNNGSLPADLTGWHLSDDSFDLAKWRFPTSSIPAGGYLLVYADKSNTSVVSGELHADFALSTDGEALVLVAADSNTVVDSVTTFEFGPGLFGYPPQTENISYGRNATNRFSYFDPATPGQVNAGGAADFVADTKFSRDRGFYSNAFELAIATTTPDATIYYTTNGSTPDASSALYDGPITINQTTCIRARAYKAALYPTDIDTHTYIFVDDVVRQSPTGNTPPTPEWPSYNVNGQRMQYGMDADITRHLDYTNRVDDALLAIPTISLVTDLDSLFDSANGIYVNADKEGDLWERVTSVELLNPDGKKGFQEDAGLRIRGGASRSDNNPKHAFRLRFRRTYGAAQLEYKIFGEDGADSSNGVDLRCAQTPSWNFTDPGNSTYLRDLFSRDLQLACGQPSTRGDHYHLYLNGVYWGMYQTQEKVEGEYAKDYLGGDDDDYDIIVKKKHGYSIVGSEALYSNLWSITTSGYGSHSNYYRAQGLAADGVTQDPTYPRLLDLENLMDYMLITYYTGEKDGPASIWATVNNYIALINHKNPDGVKHFEHDSEWSLGIGLENTVGPIAKSQWSQLNHFNGHYLHEQLVQNSEYLVAFGDWAHKRLFNDGLMTPGKAIPMIQARADEIDVAIIAESARWGDGVDDSQPQTRNDHWVPAVNSAVTWMQTRTQTVITQLRNAGWYPALDAPVFSQHGGIFSAGLQLSMTGPGTIYYTLNGTDPRQIITGAAQGSVYSSPVALTHGVIVKARAMTGTSDWSALNEAVFVANVTNALRISEVMYNPRKPEGVETNGGMTRTDFEFIEIQNTGSDEIGLAGIELKGRLSKGVSFDFTGSAVLSIPAAGHVLVVGDLEAFARRYDTNGLLIAGAFTGNLDNAGDTVELVTSRGEVLADFTYGDGRDWPATADGAGHSLIPLISTHQAGDAIEYGANWRASTYLNGSPGAANPAPVVTVRLNEIEAHTDYDNPTPPFDQYDSNDGIELYNTTAGALSLNDWYISDDVDQLRKWRIPDGAVLNGNAWRWFTEVDDFHSPITNGFGINKSGEALFLSHLPGTGADRIADSVAFQGQANGDSWGRIADGNGYWQTCTPTPNASNALTAPSVVINEVMYHPAPTVANPADNTNDEYVELCNVSGSAVALFNDGLTWRLNGGVEFAFPTNTTLDAGQCLVVVPFDPNDPFELDNKADFLSAYRQFDGEVLMLGPYAGQLANSSDRIALEQPQAPDAVGESPSWIWVDGLTYFEAAPWPADADGTGMPLQRQDSAVAGNDPSAWYASGFASPGLPDTMIDLLSPPSGTTLLIPQLADLTVAVDTQRVSGAVTHVEFLLDGQSLTIDSTPPYAYALGLSDIDRPGAYVLRARLQDAAGDHLSRLIPVQATFAPRVSILAPADGQGFIPPYSTEIVASVYDAVVVGDVSQVEFFMEGVAIGTDTNAPYTQVISAPTVAGSYALTAVMTDSLTSSTSSVVNVAIYTNTPLTDLSAVPDHTILHGNGTTLNAVLDLNGIPPELVSVQWNNISGPGQAVFGDSTRASTTASFPTAGVYVVEIVTRHGPHRYSSFRTITVLDANTPNTPRYAESFEDYLNGTRLIGFSGWYGQGGDIAPVVTERTYALASSGDQPIEHAAHTRALAIEGTVTNALTGTGSYTSLWVDSVCEMTLWLNPDPPVTRESSQLHMFAGPDGYLRVWHTPDPLNHPSSNSWTTLPGLQVTNGNFHRITIHADYQREASGHFYFELFVDGTQITQPVTRFAAANTNNAFLSRLVMSGPFTLDDLVVDTRFPFQSLYQIRVAAGANGSISPPTRVFVEAGADQQFAFTPDQFFHVADVLVDEVSIGAVPNHPFSDVSTNHTIEALFAPDMATNNTPHWWLHQQNAAWAIDYEAAALGNSDGDPMFTWQEYVAGTDPRDPDSYLWLSISNRGLNVWSIRFPATSERRYSLQRQVGALDGPWSDVHLNMMGQPDSEGMMTLEETNALDRAFYRIQPTLP
jgi:hypothetical protein